MSALKVEALMRDNEALRAEVERLRAEVARLTEALSHSVALDLSDVNPPWVPSVRPGGPA